MKKILLTLSLNIVMVSFILSQSLFTDFESFDIDLNTFLNGSEGGGGFEGEGIFLSNDFNDAYGSWTGWSISSVTDTTTPGFANQYACIAGQGDNGSTHYATTFVSGSSKIAITKGTIPLNISINNSTYAFLSMLNGDSFAKKFGGESGDDPDFFFITIKGSLNGQGKTDSIDFYLADYRFDDNSEDFIVNEWTEVDLTVLGEVDAISFTLSSSDVGAFGINTPAYFCIDDIEISDFTNSLEDTHATTTSVYPNPSSEIIQVNSTTIGSGILSLYNAQGQLVKSQKNYHPSNKVDISNLNNGMYLIEIKLGDKSRWIDRFYKN